MWWLDLPWWGWFLAGALCGSVMRSLHKRLLASRRRQWNTYHPPSQPVSASELERTNELLKELSDKLAERQSRAKELPPTMWDWIRNDGAADQAEKPG